jgi:Holliday junction DNA helicase RuvA
VLSGLRPRALARSIRDENLAGLVAIPGVGRKTAERMVVELRDKMSTLALAAGEPSTPSHKAPPRSQQSQDGIAALVRLGYSGAQAQDAVRQVEEEGEVRSLEDLVRRALSRLARPRSRSAREER